MSGSCLLGLKNDFTMEVHWKCPILLDAHLINSQFLPPPPPPETVRFGTYFKPTSSHILKPDIFHWREEDEREFLHRRQHSGEHRVRSLSPRTFFLI